MTPSLTFSSPSRDWPMATPPLRARPSVASPGAMAHGDLAWADAAPTATRLAAGPGARCDDRAAYPAADAASAGPSLSADGLAGLLDEIDTGVLVCDARGQPLLMNEAARCELAEGGVLAVMADGSLDVPGGSGVRALRRAVQAAVFERRQQLVPLRCGEHTLMVAVQPLRGGLAEPPRAVLLLGRRRLCPALAIQRLGGLYALTEAEKAVLSGLVAGHRVGALARERGVAVSTVRSQVAALRAKFGVRRLDDLTRLVAELPPMMSALRGGPVAAAQQPALTTVAAGAGGRNALHR